MPRFQKDVQASADQGPAVLEDAEVPHGQKLLLALQGSLDASKQEEVLAALKVSMHKMLVKKNYSEDRREQRKRGRNDKKIKQ
jgi:tRNA (guanine-N(7)-)-methyltransferase subunit TRM82